MGNYIYKNFFSHNQTSTKSLKRFCCENKETQVVKRFRSTFDYLYQKLFIEGEGSDITILAFNKSWRLHKLYINQSPFFATMFSGSWLENDSNIVQLEFSDKNITSNALNIIFGSFYYDSFELKETNVVSVLAASIWFQLEDLRILSEEFIIKNLNIENVVRFYELAILYEIPKLTIQCIEWLCNTILLIDDCEAFYNILQSISPKLMVEIIKNPKLFVIQIELDVFLLLLKWLYLKIHPKPNHSIKDFKVLVHNYFKSEVVDLNLYDVPELSNSIYQLFEALRWDQIISTYKAASSLSKFSIIPQNLLLSVYKNQWLSMLKSNELKISTRFINIDSELFWSKSERCGRKLVNNSNTTWRWNTYKYGIDIVIRYINREFYVIRYIDRQNCPDWMKHVPEKRRLQLHFTIASYILEKCGDNFYYPIYTDKIESGITTVELLENLPVKILSIPLKFEFPLILSANFLRYDPNELDHQNEADITLQSNHLYDTHSEQLYSV